MIKSFFLQYNSNKHTSCHIGRAQYTAVQRKNKLENSNKQKTLGTAAVLFFRLRPRIISRCWYIRWFVFNLQMRESSGWEQEILKIKSYAGQCLYHPCPPLLQQLIQLNCMVEKLSQSVLQQTTELLVMCQSTKCKTMILKKTQVLP